MRPVRELVPAGSVRLQRLAGDERSLQVRFDLCRQEILNVDFIVEQFIFQPGSAQVTRAAGGSSDIGHRQGQVGLFSPSRGKHGTESGPAAAGTLSSDGFTAPVTNSPSLCAALHSAEGDDN